MKKSAKITSITIVLILSLGLIFSFVDYLRSKDNKKPIFALKVIMYKDGGSADYFGIGYKVIKCNTLGGDTSAHFGFYNLNINKVCNTNVVQEEFTIVDETQICADALEFVYEDNIYNYYFPCIKSSTVFIVFANGQKMSVSEAFEKNQEKWGKALVEKYPEMFYKSKK